MPEPLQYKWIRNTRDLEALAPLWMPLWQQDQHATPFQSAEWLVPWWHSFGDELRSMAICQGDALLGLLPFYVYREPRSGERQLLPLGVGTSDYLDGIFAPQCGMDEIANALQTVCSDDDWDALYLSQLRAGSKLLHALNPSARDTGLIEGQSCSRMPAVTMSQLPQKIRRNAMYYRNRALRAGSLEFTIADESNWEEAFAALQRLHTERWRDRGETGVLSDERVARWHQQALPQLQRAGLLRLCSLRWNGEIIGVVYSLIDPPGRPERTQYFYITAYSIDHADLRPGTILTALAIEHAANEGVRTVDMLRGDEEYKKLWHTERVQTYGMVLYRKDIQGRSEQKTQALAA